MDFAAVSLLVDGTARAGWGVGVLCGTCGTYWVGVVPHQAK